MKLLCRLTRYDGVTPAACAGFALAPGEETRFSWNGAKWLVSLDAHACGADSLAGTLSACAEEGAAPSVSLSVLPADDLLADWKPGDYLFSPAALYDGNRFRALGGTYPPMFHREDGIGPQMETLITDVPRLGPDGGMVSLSAADIAVPCVGGWLRESGRAFLLYACHGTRAGVSGFSFSETAQGASLALEAPRMRPFAYRMMDSHAPSGDRAPDWKEGDALSLSFCLYRFPCADLRAFFARFRETRRCMGEEAALPDALPLSEAYAVIRDKYRDTQFRAEPGYYMVSPEGGRFGDWQAGWVGGGINAFALAGEDGEAAEKSRRTFETVYTRFQTPGGFVLPIVEDGTAYGDDFCHPENRNFLLVRKNADLLHFTAKYLLGLAARGLPQPPAVLAGCRRLADAFVRLFDRYGQIGQFVDMETGEILAGGTASAGIAVGALALASRLFGSAAYLRAAKGLAEVYAGCLARGVLNGGPGEILQCPDSESAFGLLEGLTALYETCGERRWLLLAADCADQALSWVMPYNFAFPAGSEFGRLGMRTVGSVFANVQNKHSAPAICTLSPLSLVRLARACRGDRELARRAAEYLRTAEEIARGCTQYLSRADRPIRAWDGRVLPSGWMCERVNTSDWEGAENVGAVFYGSCWCEISVLLTWRELPSLLIDSDSGETAVFDCLSAESEKCPGGFLVRVTNPTPYPARARVLAEPAVRRAQPWGECRVDDTPELCLAANESRVLFVPESSCGWTEAGRKDDAL